MHGEHGAPQALCQDSWTLLEKCIYRLKPEGQEFQIKIEHMRIGKEKQKTKNKTLGEVGAGAVSGVTPSLVLSCRQEVGGSRGENTTINMNLGLEGQKSSGQPLHFHVA